MTTTDQSTAQGWLDKPVAYLTHWNIEKTLVVLILVLAVISRFYMIEQRVMSHDEVNHVVPSWELFQGRGYRHDPVTHGPFQFHIVALFYFLLGDSDFSSRVPAALFSIVAVGAVMFLFKRYLGRAGALVAGFLFLISPYMLFYGRYTRNESFIQLLGVLTLYGILRYLEKGDDFSLYLLTTVTVLHFTVKETSFIYTAQLLLFAGLLFLDGVVRGNWMNGAARNRFILLMGGALLLFGVALGLAAWNAAIQTSQPQPEGSFALTPILAGEVLAFLVSVVLASTGFVILVRNLGWAAIRSLRSLDILILIGTLILPHLGAFPVSMVGWDPLDYSPAGMVRTGAFVVVLFGISVAVGMWWRPRFWLVNAVIFYAVFIVFYTTFFTNGRGFLTGLVGSLGYWLSQHGVQRGSQPWYYYWLIQIPIYEYLAALGSMAAVYFGMRYKRFTSVAGSSPADVVNTEIDESAGIQKLPILTLLVFWSVTSLVAYTVAGEKMPWLTVHIALPMLLTAAWGIGFLIETTPWKMVASRPAWMALLLMPVFLAALAAMFGSLLGDTPPFQGNTLDQLQATGTFLQVLLISVLSAGGIWYLLRSWMAQHVYRLAGTVVFALLALLTVRTSIMASYINYDYATEYLVYAHAASGPKEVLAQVEEISRRTTGGLDISVAYDNDGLYPFWWYFRNFPNHRWFTDAPTRDLREVPLIISGDATAGKMQPVVQDNYVEFEYMRLWWPNQDYFNLTWQRVWDAVRDPKMRTALFNIWLNRDYRLYAELTNNPSLTLETWQPSSKMRFYIRKDVVAQMWNYGVAPVAQELVLTDPYQEQISPLEPDQVLGAAGSDPGLFQSPRGLAAGQDGSVYVADSRNHRIQHFSADGDLIEIWGSYADATQPGSQAPGGTFNEPWGIAVAPDGTVYVADTWNHRIQKFTADGTFLTMWGYFGTAVTPDAFWGPRDVAVDSKGRVYVTDTGNKRVAIFSPDGEFITQFGSVGIELGQFDEPVGIAISSDDSLYVADTWNQRVQGFLPGEDDLTFLPSASWEIYGWFGQSLDNKPYLALDPEGNVLVTDPEAYRLLQFTASGEFIRGWGEYGTGAANFSIYNGVAVDGEGRVWISDAGNNRILRFALP